MKAALKHALKEFMVKHLVDVSEFEKYLKAYYDFKEEN